MNMILLIGSLIGVMLGFSYAGVGGAVAGGVISASGVQLIFWMFGKVVFPSIFKTIIAFGLFVLAFYTWGLGM